MNKDARMVINIHGPWYKTHLGLQEDMARASTGKDKAQIITIRKGCELDTRNFGAILIDGPVEGKGFSKVRVQVNFFSATSSRTESGGTEFQS